MNWHKGALLFLTLLPALVQAGNPCALNTSGGIGGTGNAQDGIGGTGLIDPRDGIGGTGAQAKRDEGMGGTGIVGIVTGFASVCVVGVEVHYDDATPVTVNGVPASAGNLSVGQLVSIVAQPAENGYRASQIAVQHAVAGPISRIDPLTGHLDVLGQKVAPAANAVRDANGQPMAASALKPGMSVLVSGLRGYDGQIIASRVEHSARPVSPRITPMQLPDKVDRIIVQGIVHRRDADSVKLDHGIEIYIPKNATIRGGELQQLLPGHMVRISATRGERKEWQALDLELQSARDVTRRAGAAYPNEHEKSGHKGGSRGESSGRDGEDDENSDDQDLNSGSGRSGGGGQGGNRSGESRPDSAEIESRDDDRNEADFTLSESSERIDRSEKSDRSDKTDKFDRVDKSGKIDRVEKIEKPEKQDKIERPDRSGRGRD